MKPAFLAWIWLGIVIGVSFMATPIKFTATSLDLPTALEVGRVTFRLLSRVEWALATLFVVAVWRTKQRWPWWCMAVLAILVLEAAWLLPALGARTDAIRAGTAVPPSSLHRVFIAAEIGKCVALARIGILMSRSPAS